MPNFRQQLPEVRRDFMLALMTVRLVENAMGISRRIVEVRPASDARLARMGCFEVFEGEGVKPIFPSRDLALSYARQRTGYGHCEIQVLDDSWTVVQTIGNEEARPLV